MVFETAIRRDTGYIGTVLLESDGGQLITRGITYKGANRGQRRVARLAAIPSTRTSRSSRPHLNFFHNHPQRVFLSSCMADVRAIDSPECLRIGGIDLAFRL